MVKTMLVALFLGALSVGVAEDTAQCAVDGAAAVNDLSDAAMFTWAASKRCGQKADSKLYRRPGGAEAYQSSKVECAIDITSAAQGASNMIATIGGRRRLRCYHH